MFNANEIEELIIQGGKTVKFFEFTVGDQERKLKWSPVVIERAQIAFARGLEKVEDPVARQWINTSPKLHEGMFGPKYEPNTSELLTFNHWNTLWVIKFALEPHYPNITVHQVEQLPIKHRDLFIQISLGSGLVKSEETARSFRGESEELPDKSDAEPGSTP